MEKEGDVEMEVEGQGKMEVVGGEREEKAEVRM